jgi:hypothetical protein
LWLTDRQVSTTSELEVRFARLWTQCQRCQGSLHQVPALRCDEPAVAYAIARMYFAPAKTARFSICARRLRKTSRTRRRCWTGSRTRRGDDGVVLLLCLLGTPPVLYYSCIMGRTFHQPGLPEIMCAQEGLERRRGRAHGAGPVHGRDTSGCTTLWCIMTVL